MAGRTAADIYYRLEIDDTSAVAKLERMGRHLRNFGVAFTAMGAVAGAALMGIVGKFAKVGDQLDKMSKRVDISVESLSELKFAAEQSGASLEGLDPSIKKMQYSIAEAADGTATYVDALARVGLTAKQLEGLTVEEKFLTIGTAIGGVADETQRAAAAQEIFGRGGMTLLPLLKEGADGIARLREEARTTGNVMTTEQARIAAEYTDAMNKIKHTMMGVVTVIGTQLAPHLTKLADKVSASIPKLAKWIQENGWLIKSIGLVTAALLVLGPGFTAVGYAMMNLTRIIGVLRAAFNLMAGPTGWAILAFSSILGLVLKLRGNTKRLADENRRLAESYREIARAKLQDEVTRGQAERATVAERINRIKAITGSGRELTGAEKTELRAHVEAVQGYLSSTGGAPVDAAALFRGDSDTIERLKLQMAGDAASEYTAIADAAHNDYVREMTIADGPRDTPGFDGARDRARAAEAEWVKYLDLADQMRSQQFGSVDMGLVTSGVAYDGSAAESQAQIAALAEKSAASVALSEEARAYTESLQDEIDVAKLRAELEGEKLDLAMLERERASRLAEAASFGVSADLVNTLFDLRAGQIASDAKPTPNTVIPDMPASFTAMLAGIDTGSSGAARGAAGFGATNYRGERVEDDVLGGGGGGQSRGSSAGGFIANARVAALQGLSQRTSLEASSGRTAAATEKTAEAAKKIIENTDPKNLYRGGLKPILPTFTASVGGRLGATT